MTRKPPWWRTRAGVAMIGFALVGAFYVLRGHWGHAFGALPYLLLLVCSLMHFLLHRVLLHRGHGHRHGGGPP